MIYLRQRACRQVTADKQALINGLVELIYDFLPLGSHSSNAITFHSIFKESRIHRYLKKVQIKPTDYSMDLLTYIAIMNNCLGQL